MDEASEGRGLRCSPGAALLHGLARRKQRLAWRAQRFGKPDEPGRALEMVVDELRRALPVGRAIDARPIVTGKLSEQMLSLRGVPNRLRRRRGEAASRRLSFPADRRSDRESRLARSAAVIWIPDRSLRDRRQ